MLQTVSGTGKDGRITKVDAVNASSFNGNANQETRSSPYEIINVAPQSSRTSVAKNETAMLTTFNKST
jgi:2-oxoglutarate dehydrogenase E2 component (dihydrolipoamide succinyltransferase)